MYGPFHRFCSFQLISGDQMAIALGATGWFMYIDIPETPRAVVVCVIIYNAFFGYRYVIAIRRELFF